MAEKCELCNGHGTEICNNPDHGGIDSGLFGSDNGRIGCPVCGHDEYCRVKGTVCVGCNGTGESQPNQERGRE